MPKYPEELRNVSVPPPGRWVWREETRTLELISSGPTEEGVLRKRRQINVNFSDLQQRSEWLAEISTSNHRGRQSIRKSLSPAHLHAYRSFVLKNQGGRITTDDVKQVAVSLLQENYSLPIPFCFLAVLKSKELDEVLAALLLYLSFFFEHNSLEKSSKSFMTVDLFTEHKMKAETLAKKEIVQKKLAVRYFNLIMDLDTPSYHKGWMSSNSTRWLLHACLYSFFCFVAWVTFGRKDLRDIQEEVGRLLYSDTFNTAMRNRTERDSGMAFASVNGSVKTGEADPKETGCSGAFKHRCNNNFAPCCICNTYSKVPIVTGEPSSHRFSLNPCLTLSLAVARGRSLRQVQIFSLLDIWNVSARHRRASRFMSLNSSHMVFQRQCASREPTAICL
ncbi:protein phosphatase 1 regulatory subunit 36 isoform X3 [Sebastes umbrosus]|uniref:protein phosphatase 1 regulatory subunit 36 isoform X3 n=1 Tax=Sebastes umbrosus TaxID=72105 RepID=UPI00189CBD6F|nr:protein phosphatase 1 regulatory subunit 36 isoform X3 [Sebastes umbrosus]